MDVTSVGLPRRALYGVARFPLEEVGSGTSVATGNVIDVPDVHGLLFGDVVRNGHGSPRFAVRGYSGRFLLDAGAPAASRLFNHCNLGQMRLLLRACSGRMLLDGTTRLTGVSVRSTGVLVGHTDRITSVTAGHNGSHFIGLSSSGGSMLDPLGVRCRDSLELLSLLLDGTCHLQRRLEVS